MPHNFTTTYEQVQRFRAINFLIHIQNFPSKHRSTSLQFAFAAMKRKREHIENTITYRNWLSSKWKSERAYASAIKSIVFGLAIKKESSHADVLGVGIRRRRLQHATQELWIFYRLFFALVTSIIVANLFRWTGLRDCVLSHRIKLPASSSSKNSHSRDPGPDRRNRLTVEETRALTGNWNLKTLLGQLNTWLIDSKSPAIS